MLFGCTCKKDKEPQNDEQRITKVQECLLEALRYLHDLETVEGAREAWDRVMPELVDCTNVIINHRTDGESLWIERDGRMHRLVIQQYHFESKRVYPHG